VRSDARLSAQKAFFEAALAGKAGTRIVQAAGRDSVSTVATDLERGVA